jgi:hypothetical protein
MLMSHVICFVIISLYGNAGSIDTSHPKALAWAGGSGFHLIQARPKPLLSHCPWQGLAWPGLALGLKLGQNSTNGKIQVFL